MSLVKNDDVMDLIVVFCILFVFMLVPYCFCVATEFSVSKDLHKRLHLTRRDAGRKQTGTGSLSVSYEIMPELNNIFCRAR